MRQIVYVILGLIALFTVVRAYGVYQTEEEQRGLHGHGRSAGPAVEQTVD